jgi:hypothetical protein
MQVCRPEFRFGEALTLGIAEDRPPPIWLTTTMKYVRGSSARPGPM